MADTTDNPAEPASPNQQFFCMVCQGEIRCPEPYIEVLTNLGVQEGEGGNGRHMVRDLSYVHLAHLVPGGSY